jgi:hypothetical protein
LLKLAAACGCWSAARRRPESSVSDEQTRESKAVGHGRGRLPFAARWLAISIICFIWLIWSCVSSLRFIAARICCPRSPIVIRIDVI